MLNLETAAERFENVTVLDEMPADQMGKVMNIMSASLGVGCTYCHQGTNFAAEGVALKDTAREMLTMTLAINKTHFAGNSRVTCNTCHRGQPVPQSDLELSSFRKPIDRSETKVSKPKEEFTAEEFTAAEILNRHVIAIGGSEKLASLRSLHVIANRIEPMGKTEPEELWQTATGQSRMVTMYGKLAVIEGFDGQSAWKQAGDSSIQLKPDEAEQLTTENAIAFGLQIARNYSTILPAGTQRIDRPHGRRTVQVLLARRLSGMEEQLFFDSESGLLVRRVATVPTVLGPFECQVDYLSYNDFEGLLAPAQIRFAVPGISWTREVTSLEINLPLEESFFRKPNATQ